MKRVIGSFGFVVGILILSSCSSSRPIMDDNVYMLKTAAIPIGENLLDETSYSTYKYREESKNPTSGYYNPANQNNRTNGPSFLNRPSLFFSYGYLNPYGYFGFNPYAHYNPFFGSFGYGFSPYSNYYNPYGFYNPNSYYGQYGGFGNFYNYGNSGFGNGGIIVNNQPQASAGHYVSGPRATNSGYFSGVSRGGKSQLKSQAAPHVNPSSTINSGTSVSRSTPMPQGRNVGQTTSSQPQFSRDNQTVAPVRGTESSRYNNSNSRYNNQQARPVQSRGNHDNGVNNSRSNPGRSSNVNLSAPRNSSPVSTPQRSNGGSVTSPSKSSPAPSRPSGTGRRQ